MVSGNITVGFEVEGFGGPYDEKIVRGLGEISADAAPDLFELIGNPAHNLDVAIKNIAGLAEALPGCAEYVFKRPESMAAGAGIWRRSQRYEALKQAVAIEQPESWRGIEVMTERAATHVNLGIDWATPQGLAWLSVMNNIAPYLSSRLHTEHGVECTDVLTPWQGWASPKRLPSPYYWWTTQEDLLRHFLQVPRLIRPGEVGEPDAVPDLKVVTDLTAMYHLGTIWYFGRPKIAPNGVRYVELRVLVSLDPRTQAFRDIVTIVYELSSALVKMVSHGVSRKSAPDLFSDLRHSGFLKYVPQQTQMLTEWQVTRAWSKQDSAIVAIA